jgi:hypothetical protein
MNVDAGAGAPAPVAAPPSDRLSGLAKLTVVGLIATAIGFLGAGVNPGPGPRVVHGALTVGPVYLPPLLVGLVTLIIAGLVAVIRIRWMPAVGAAFAAILLIGAFSLGSASVGYRLTHPGAGIGFVEDSLQLVGEVIAIVAGIAATVQAYRSQ